MMNSNTRAKLRSLAMNIQPLTQVGKNGISDTLIKQVDEQLESRELIKIAVLKNAEVDAGAVALELAEVTSSEVVQVIGSKITLYRVSKKDNVKHVL